MDYWRQCRLDQIRNDGLRGALRIVETTNQLIGAGLDVRDGMVLARECLLGGDQGPSWSGSQEVEVAKDDPGKGVWMKFERR